MLKFVLSRHYRGIGGSEGLERGLLVYKGDRLLIEEGMGLGAVALQAGGFTFFASLAEARCGTTVTDRQDKMDPAFMTPGQQDAERPAAEDPAAERPAAEKPAAEKPAGVSEWTAVYRFDRRLVWKILGRPSTLFTRLLEAFVTYGYMRFEAAQPRLLAFGAHMVRLFRIEAIFKPVKAMGQATVSYLAGPDAVDMAVTAEWQHAKARLFVMNELGGSLFSAGLADGQTVRPPSGWQRMDSRKELYSPQLNLAFGLEEVQVPADIASTLYWGREMTDAFCWAGFESDLCCPGRLVSDYRIRIRFRHTPGQREGTS